LRYKPEKKRFFVQKLLIIILITGLADTVKSQGTEFSAPWQDSSRAIIADAYAGNSIDTSKICSDKRLAGIIHKASQGLKTDPKYAERKKIARRKNLLFGSYHLGTNADPVQQADFYLAQTNSDSAELMALDLEGLDSSKFMSLTNAEIFIRRIYEKTARYPVLYCSHEVFSAICKRDSLNSVFGSCPLWYARLKSSIPAFDKKVWGTYSIWQFSCEINCAVTGKCWYNIPGTDKNMDVNVYNGTVAELRQNWPNLKK
jgi:lysozyme